MVWSTGDRRKFLRALDDAESGLLLFYNYLLYVLIVIVTLLAVFFFRSVASDAFRDFLRLYGGIVYLVFIAWAVRQLFAIRSRQSRVPSGSKAPSPGNPGIAIKFAKDPETGARRFSFHLGSGTPPSSSSKTVRIGFSTSSLADEDKPDDAALAQADAYINAGVGLDTVCRLLNTRYKDWSFPQQQVFRAHLQSQIELRKPSSSQRDETLASSPESETHFLATQPEATSFRNSDEDVPRSRQPWLTPTQIVLFFIIFFAILTAGLLVALFFSHASQQ